MSTETRRGSLVAALIHEGENAGKLWTGEYSCTSRYHPTFFKICPRLRDFKMFVVFKILRL